MILAFILALLAAPYLTYLLRDAEILDFIRSVAIRNEFISDLLDCEKCTSQWSGFICAGLAMLSPHLPLFLWVLGSMACASASVIIYNKYLNEENKLDVDTSQLRVQES